MYNSYCTTRRDPRRDRRSPAWRAGLTLIVALLLMMSLLPAQASGAAALVTDINRQGVGTMFTGLAQVGNTLFFARSDHGAELWKSDGSAAGTQLVRQGIAGPNWSGNTWMLGTRQLLFFVVEEAATADSERVLWRSDGSTAGTFPLKRLGPSSSYPCEMAVVSDRLFFTANEPSAGQELWQSDGGAAGTSLVMDIFPGPSGSSPFELTNVNGTLFFSASDTIGMRGLWRSDGTAAGTVRITDITPNNLTSVNGSLFFTTNDFSSGDRELWKSDGTAAGTVPIKVFTRAATPGAFSDFVAVGSTLYFSINFSSIEPIGMNGIVGTASTLAQPSDAGWLWKSDGTAAGTVQVTSLGFSPSVHRLKNVGDRLFFVADDGSSGNELWTSDGTAAGTQLVKDIVPGAQGSTPASLTDVNGTLFFVANNAWQSFTQWDITLWKSDGTAAGTVPVMQFTSTAGAAAPRELVNVGGTLFFSAGDFAAGEELWRSDGTTNGTYRVKDITPGTVGSGPYSLTYVDPNLFFVADDGRSGPELWASDGTAAGTRRLTDQVPGYRPAAPAGLTSANGLLFFSPAEGEHARELWKSDGTITGTIPVKMSAVQVEQSTPSICIGATLYFAGFDTYGVELWRSDGTDAGTQRIKDIFPGSESSHPRALTDVNGVLFFTTENARGVELWTSDGTAAGTRRVTSQILGPGWAGPSGLTNVDGMLFFAAADAQGGTELWRSDGTEAGTLRIKDIRPGSGSSDPSDLVEVNGTLFFAADDGGSGWALWKSDGTEAGTVRVKDMFLGQDDPYGETRPSGLTNVQGTLFFSAVDDSSGRELWRSDGTAAGTLRVKDIQAGPGSAYPESLTNAAGTLFFRADDGTHGPELWESDGTEAGTVLAQDLLPGAYGSYPYPLKIVRDKLFFSAESDMFGRELWVAPLRALGVDIYVYSAFLPQMRR